MLAEQKRVKQEKKDLTNELRNAQRRRKRLKYKARLLSQMDLLEVMNLRTDEEHAKRLRTDEAQVLTAPRAEPICDGSRTGQAAETEEAQVEEADD